MSAAGRNNNAPSAKRNKPVRMPFLYPNRWDTKPAGIAKTKYPRYTATSMKEDCVSLRSQTFLSFGMSIPLILCKKAHRKNKVQTRMKGKIRFLLGMGDAGFRPI